MQGCRRLHTHGVAASVLQAGAQPKSAAQRLLTVAPEVPGDKLKHVHKSCHEEGLCEGAPRPRRLRHPPPPPLRALALCPCPWRCAGAPPLPPLPGSVSAVRAGCNTRACSAPRVCARAPFLCCSAFALVDASPSVPILMAEKWQVPAAACSLCHLGLHLCYLGGLLLLRLSAEQLPQEVLAETERKGPPRSVGMHLHVVHPMPPCHGLGAHPGQAWAAWHSRVWPTCQRSDHLTDLGIAK